MSAMRPTGRIQQRFAGSSTVRVRTLSPNGWINTSFNGLTFFHAWAWVTSKRRQNLPGFKAARGRRWIERLGEPAAVYRGAR